MLRNDTKSKKIIFPTNGQTVMREITGYENSRKRKKGRLKADRKKKGNKNKQKFKTLPMTTIP